MDQARVTTELDDFVPAAQRQPGKRIEPLKRNERSSQKRPNNIAALIVASSCRRIPSR